MSLLFYVTGSSALDVPSLYERVRSLLHDRFVIEPRSTILLTRGGTTPEFWAREVADFCGTAWVEYRSDGWRYSSARAREPWHPSPMPACADPTTALLADISTKLAQGWAFAAMQIGTNLFPLRDPLLDFARTLDVLESVDLEVPVPELEFPWSFLR